MPLSRQPVATIPNIYHQHGYANPSFAPVSKRRQQQHHRAHRQQLAQQHQQQHQQQQQQQYQYPQYHDPGLGMPTLAYRTPSIAATTSPLHLPFSQTNRLLSAPPVFPEANFNPHSLGLPSNTRPSTIATPVPIPSSNPHLLHQQPQQHLLPIRPRHHNLSRPTATMAAPIQPQQLSADDMEEMQRLSNKWEPETTGPLVSQRSPTTAIVAEYSSGGETFQQKTAWLAQKYPSYRTVRGDGRCGWRAIAFGYFEGLIQYADATKFLEEEARLRSLNNVLNAAGFDQYLYEDFADEVFDLIRRLGTALSTNNAEQSLEETFNDDNISMCIITHLRSLTKAWMVTNPADYEAFCEGRTIDQYADDNIMPVTSEIDHIGMSALNSVLLAPAGIGLEVSYLDQSVGTEVNVHSFDRDGSGVPTIHIVRLLYRPGHYDILYKPEDLTPEPASVPTYLQFGSHAHNDPIYDLGVSDFMTMIPGMSYAPSCGGGWMSSSSNMSFAPSDPFQPVSSVPPAPSAAPIPQTSTTPIPRLANHQTIQPQSAYSMQSAHASAQQLPPNQILQQEFGMEEMPQASVAHPIQSQLAGGGPFRPSVWELKPDLQATSQVPFQTSIFRNSHFNTAHFLNPDFQPEEWSPETEYVTFSSKSRQRSSASG